MQGEPKEMQLPVPGREGVSVRFAWREYGAPDAPRTACCVHGLSRNAWDFDILARRLAAENFRVICPDMPGRGLSGWLEHKEDYNNVLYLQLLLFWLAALKVEKLHWVGTSMGGILGMMLCAAAPGMIRRLVLNDIGAEIPATALERIANYIVWKTSFPSREEAEAALRERMATFGVRPEQWQEVYRYSFVEEADGKVRFAYDPLIGKAFLALRDDKGRMSDMDLWELWDAVPCPVLLIRGDKSDVLTEAAAEKMQDSRDNVRLLTIEGCGHAPMLMDDWQVGVVKGFLAAG